jgi:hypothetical protein
MTGRSAPYSWNLSVLASKTTHNKKSVLLNHKKVRQYDNSYLQLTPNKSG